MKAQEAAEIAGAKGDKVAEEEIRRRYGNKESAASIAGEASELNTLKIQKYNRNNAAGGLKTQSDADQAALKALTNNKGDKQNETTLKALSDAQAELDRKAKSYDLAALRSEAHSLESQMATNPNLAGLGLSLYAKNLQIKSAEDAIKAADENRAKTEALNAAVLEHKEAIEKATTAAAKSLKAFNENAEAIQSLTDKINTESAILDIHKSTSKTVGEIAAPTTLGGSALLAERRNAALIASGHIDQVSGDSQEIIANLGTLMAGHSVTLKQAAQMVLRADATKDSLQAAVAAMDRTSEKMITYCDASAKRLGKIEDKLAELTSQIRDIHNK